MEDLIVVTYKNESSAKENIDTLRVPHLSWAGMRPARSPGVLSQFRGRRPDEGAGAPPGGPGFFERSKLDPAQPAGDRERHAEAYALHADLPETATRRSDLPLPGGPDGAVLGPAVVRAARPPVGRRAAAIAC